MGLFSLNSSLDGFCLGGENRSLPTGGVGLSIFSAEILGYSTDFFSIERLSEAL